MRTSNNKFLRIYIYVSLFLIVVLLAALVGAIAYGSTKIKTETNTINTKVDSFNQDINTVNKNLENINTQLEKQNSETSALKLTGL